MERIFITSGTYTHDFLATFVLKGVTLPLIVSWNCRVSLLGKPDQGFHSFPFTADCPDEDCSNRVGFCREGVAWRYLALLVLPPFSLKTAILKGIF